MVFATIEEAIKDLQGGKFIIIVDDERRENEGDLMIAAEKITKEKLNFMIKHARGLICVPVISTRLDELKIPLMVKNNTDKFNTAFTISVDAKDVYTGVSVSDRVKTIKKLINKNTKPEDLLRPGHVFPLRAHPLGLKARRGHTEASIELCKLANLYPAAVIAEIMKDDGEMARLPDLEKFSTRHNIKIITIKDLIKFLKN